MLKPLVSWSKKLSEKQKIIIGAILAILVVAMSFSLWLSINTAPVNQDEGKEVKVDVRLGASIEEVAALLSSEKLIKSPLAFSVLARLSGAKIEAGTYIVSPSMSVSEILNTIRSSSSSNYNITISPGQTLPEIKDTLIAYGFSAEEVEAAFSKDYDHPLLKTKPNNVGLDGYIFPDTYEMNPTDSVSDLLLRIFDHLYQKMQSDGSLGVMQSRQLSIHDALTLASIVSKEASDDVNQRIIAAVFYNRLNNNIRLGSDVTYQYAYKMGYCDKNLPSCDSSYNTRMYEGLPPGPISNMNYSSIQAVLHPTDNDNFYFVAGDDGRIYYAETEDEHQSNIDNYCHELCR